MRVRFTPQAERQYRGALRYVHTRSPDGAAAVQQRAAAVIDLLREYPYAGDSIPEFPDLPHRELQVSPYRFFYRIIDDTVWIVAVRHARQLPERVDDAARG
jgi:toxin ParE1/3/4